MLVFQKKKKSRKRTNGTPVCSYALLSFACWTRTFGRNTSLAAPGDLAHRLQNPLNFSIIYNQGPATIKMFSISKIKCCKLIGLGEWWHVSRDFKDLGEVSPKKMDYR